MKYYVINYFEGGVPMEGGTLTIVNSMEKAQQILKQSAKDAGYEGKVEWELFRDENGGDFEGQLRSWYYDDEEGDFWGGYRIEVFYLDDNDFFKYNELCG